MKAYLEDMHNLRATYAGLATIRLIIRKMRWLKDTSSEK